MLLTWTLEWGRMHPETKKQHVKLQNGIYENDTRRMLHDVIVLVPFFNFFYKKARPIINKTLFSIFFPPGGNVDIDAGDVGDHLEPIISTETQTLRTI